MGEIIYLPQPKQELTPEQRAHWQEEAAFWGIKEEEAARKREDALRMLGMLGTEKGLS